MSNRHASRAATVIAILLIIAAQSPFTNAARADKKTTIVFQSMSADDLKKKCDAAGGTFDNYGSDWSCTTKKGSVTCDSKKCTGTTSSASALMPRHLRDPGTVLETLGTQ